MIYSIFSLFLFLIGAYFFFRSDIDLWSALWIRFFSNPHEKFRNKNIWIIGASSGIGAQMSYDLSVKYGAKVALSARRENELKNVAQKCMEGNKSIIAPIVVPYDIRGTVDYHKQIAEKVISALGSIDYLILNSGQTQRAIAEETDIEVTKGMIDINVIGLISALKAVLPHFIQRRSGHVLVTSSVAGRLSSSLISSYSLTKFALQGYFESLRVELFHKNIKITLALPGPVDTPIMSAAWGAKSDQQGEAERANDSAERKMSCERCADLMIRGTAAELDELWCTTQPTLFFMYLYQYAPSIARFINKRMGSKRIEAFKNNSDPNFAFNSITSFIKGGKKE